MKEEITSLLHRAITSITESCILESISKQEEELTLILTYCRQSACNNTSYSAKDYILVDSIIDRIWERLNTGRWKDVPPHLRDLYGYASFIKAVMMLRRTLCQENETLKNLTETIKAIDMGLLLGSSFRSELSQLAASLCHLIHSISDNTNETISLFDNITVDNLNESLGEPVPELFRPSIESFLSNYFTSRVPVKLKGCTEHWPALEKWQNVNYIMQKIGPRTVPVEIGSSYANSNWSQKLMTVRSFIENFMLNKKEEIGYLAQHQLFNQIPELLEDIREPEYCVLSDNYEDVESGTDVNAWFGPAHTVSPLHYDPKHNLLTQIVGIKRVILIDPKWSENVYPYDDHLLHNTAQINVEEPDFEAFPKFKNVKCLQCILEPGDMLYIPPKWWHHVRSLSASFSVSFWWS